MPRVTFQHPEGLSGDVPTDTSLLEAAEQLGFPLPHDCGGNASCTTCRVEILSGAECLTEIDFEEQDLLDREAFTESWHRLGCQARVRGMSSCASRCTNSSARQVRRGRAWKGMHLSVRIRWHQGR